MVTKTDNLLDILKTAMDTCSKNYTACEGCQKIAACIDLWDKACDHSVSKPLTVPELQNYIKEFILFLGDRNKDCSFIQ